MVSTIHRDLSRAKEIIRGKVREDLKRHINHGEMIGRRGKDTISIPIPSINIPRFRFGPNEGVGQGEGDIGEPIGRGGYGGDDDDGSGQAGDQPGNHILEEFTLEELAQMLGEELELPNLEPKGRQRIASEKYTYKGVHSVGPESLRIPRRTLKEAIIHSLSGIDLEELEDPLFDPSDYIVITPPDKRYRSPKISHEFETSAVIIYVMDVSGSMSEREKSIVRRMSFWMDLWIRSQYKGVESRYIIHDAVSKEVNQNTFYHTRESGGTRISSAYRRVDKMTDVDSGYRTPFGGVSSPQENNIYVFHFTDGDNWGDDDQEALDLLNYKILPRVNLFGYIQIESLYGDGDFIDSIQSLHADNDNLVAIELESEDDIFEGIKIVLGKQGQEVS